VPQLLKAIISELLKSVPYHGMIGFLCMSWVADSKVITGHGMLFHLRALLERGKKEKRNCFLPNFPAEGSMTPSSIHNKQNK
jgi:hypothetical protein